jgi:hypothetical protein
MFPGEAGVRFVEICQGGWDHPTNLHPGVVERCRAIDQAAALHADLRQRGLLDDTIVLFGSKFGRLPMSQGPDGRNHYITTCMPHCSRSWASITSSSLTATPAVRSPMYPAKYTARSSPDRLTYFSAVAVKSPAAENSGTLTLPLIFAASMVPS